MKCLDVLVLMRSTKITQAKATKCEVSKHVFRPVKKKCQIDSEAWDSVKWAIICDREKYVNRQCPL